ncbi:DUF4097 family beta strand repeat-containing protein [Paenibacillus physcomitrellae]|uniref:DUF4097 domain-containing protein n=1 Tax=Paenibacillus physcomitrellae TaxID=1619311 RepID=A0ABQ1GUI5_9BACL|nr:DUF4097 family beta strand repeat-containing protein [Paenibacillus physcomitrellae]GGA50688.1 hypothetical protein GCM10010917_39970 [Paenibacillus physcomitrellae]
MKDHTLQEGGSGHTEKMEGPGGGAKTVGFKPRRRKLKLISVLLTALFPGLGHLYLRQLGKGITLIYFILIDAASLVYFSSVRMHINVPLLILLAILIPVIYFYSIYDVLQSTDYWNARRSGTARHKRTAAQAFWRGLGMGAQLIGGGLILFLLRQQPAWLSSFIQNYAGYTVAGFFLAAAVLLFMGENRRKFRRTGRLTASLFAAGVGILLILDLSLNRDAMLLLLRWWPVLLILLGFEAIFNMLRVRNKRSTAGMGRIRFDLRGMLLTLAAAVSVFAITQQDHYVQLWQKVSLDLTAASMEFSEEKGYSVTKPALEIPLPSETRKLSINGINGNITISREAVFNVQVQYKVYVDSGNLQEAASIAEQTHIEATADSTLGLVVKDAGYGQSGKRHPKVNMNIVIPFNRSLTMNVTTTNGNLLVKNLAADHVVLETGNGKIELRNLQGEFKASTLNGDGYISGFQGDITMNTQGGNLSADNIQGKLKLSTLVGDIAVRTTSGDIDVNTKNGNLDIEEAPKKLDAQTLNGMIRVESNVIGGDWNVYSAVGELHITLPEQADYTLEGSSGYGGIETNLPFPVENKTIKGTWGTGEYKVNLDGNSNVFIYKEAINALDPLPAQE